MEHRRSPIRPDTRSKILNAELAARLREGSTLILEQVDELDPAIRCLAEGLERDLGQQVSINLYAGWRTSVGFSVHSDDHDVFILQVHGRKLRKLFGRPEKLPVPGDRGLRLEASPSQPIWEAILTPGDALYIPRGW